VDESIAYAFSQQRRPNSSRLSISGVHNLLAWLSGLPVAVLIFMCFNSFINSNFLSYSKIMMSKDWKFIYFLITYQRIGNISLEKH